MPDDYRTTEICPNCGKKLIHSPSYGEDIWGTWTEVEYGLMCPDCGRIDYFVCGKWDNDIQ